MKRSTLNFTLLAAVAGLGAAVWFTQKEAEKGPPLTALAADAIERIAILYPGHSAEHSGHPGAAEIQLAKQNGEWRVVAPVQAAADPLEVATLINLASQQTHRRLKLTETDTRELKLEPPQFSVMLNDQKLDFGDIDPLEYRRYVRVGDEIALIDDPPAASVDADYSDLVGKELLPAKAEIARIDVPGLKVERQPDGKTWAATSAGADAGAAAGGDALARFVDGWSSARAMWNAAMPADGGQGEPIRITLKDGQTLDFAIAAREPQLLLDRPAWKLRYTLSKADEALLLTLAPPPRPEALPPTGDAPATSLPAPTGQEPQ